MLVLIAVIVILLLWGGLRLMNKKIQEFSDICPGPPTIPILGNALQLMVPAEEIISTLGKLIEQYGDIVRIWLGPDMNVIVSDPDDIKTLLTSPKTSIKGRLYKYIIAYCGNGILSGSGHTWRTSRRTIMPNYGKQAIDSYEDVINREADETVKRLRLKVGGGAFNVIDEVLLGTAYTACQTLIGLSREQTVDLPKLSSTILKRSHEVLVSICKRMTTWNLQIEPLFWMTKQYKVQRQFDKDFNELGYAIVQHRLKYLDTMDDKTKTAILNAEDDSKRHTELGLVDRLVLSNQISYREVLKQLCAAFFTSQDSSGKAVSFLLLMMAFYPECQDKLYAEIKRTLGDNGRAVTDEDLKQMPYLDMVFKETVRLFPAAVMLQRTIAEDITISKGMTLPAGSSLLIPVFHLHRHKKHWTNPDAFDPERFSPENTKSRNPNCYIPFSMGPMGCMGRSFAYKLIKTTCVWILREFQVSSPVTFADLRLVMAVSVASADGYPIQLHPRN